MPKSDYAASMQLPQPTTYELIAEFSTAPENLASCHMRREKEVSCSTPIKPRLSRPRPFGPRPLPNMSFNGLPFELRLAIWSLAAESRRITNMRILENPGEFRKKHRNKGHHIRCEATATPAPALMHVCRESRQHAPYQRAFTRGTEPRWTWVNFKLDVFCVTSLRLLPGLASHYSEIQRVRIQTNDDVDWYEDATMFNALEPLLEFEIIRDIQVVLELGDLWWADVYAHHAFDGYGGEKSFIDESTGLTLTGEQLTMAFDWELFFAFGRDGNPPAPDDIEGAIAWANDSSAHLTMAQIREVE
ncbi:hypothetical protein CC79DRAFT_460866 [Sarocladium strictum]